MDLRLNVGTGWLIAVVFDVDVGLGVLFNVSLVFVWYKFWLAVVLCFSIGFGHWCDWSWLGMAVLVLVVWVWVRAVLGCVDGWFSGSENWVFQFLVGLV